MYFTKFYARSERGQKRTYDMQARFAIYVLVKRMDTTAVANCCAHTQVTTVL